MEFVYPVLILAAIALIFGVLLAFLGNKFAVKTDPREAETRELLAGANCGACGYAGCDAYAKALAEGRAKLSECSVTSKENKDKIAALLGVENGGEEQIVVVACQGGVSCADKYEYIGLGDCAAAASVAGGQKACSYACLGFGNCARVCPTGAMTVENGAARVKQDKCIRCGLCVEACPRNLIQKIPDGAAAAVLCRNRDKGAAVKKICSKGCLACGICAKACPAGAITMVKNLPVIDYGVCTDCGLCAEKCPAHTIVKGESLRGR